METEVLIVGAGLAGLSAGYHLGKRDHTIVEAENSVGGLCRSFAVDGFHFDCTGHLIHFRSQEGRKIITSLLSNRIQEHQRRAAIFLCNRFTDYPFQANTYGLPPEVIKECLVGFVETLNKKKTRLNNFYDWVLDTFGSGIAKYFMVPYNEKLWQHDLHDIALDWVNWSIPKPNVEEVINGALGIKNRQFGYNPVFYYPSEGGISMLPESFPVNGSLQLGNALSRIDIRQRKAITQDGREFRYRYLFSTMPLNSFVKLIDDAPSSVQAAGEQLQHVSVLNINLGIERENVVPYHWIYFPERDKPFYRIGCASNFSAKVAPKGTSSLFVEVSLRPNKQHNIQEIVAHSIQSLKSCGILRQDDRIPVIYPVLLRHAYVIYDKHRKRAVEKIHKFLNARGVYSFGRYGSWIYSSMEDAVLQGKEFAEKLAGDGGR
jgi:protoporphyrinogen oxidase